MSKVHIITITFNDNVTWEQAEAFLDEICELAEQRDLTITTTLDAKEIEEGGKNEQVP